MGDTNISINAISFLVNSNNTESIVITAKINIAAIKVDIRIFCLEVSFLFSLLDLFDMVLFLLSQTALFKLT